MGNNYNIWRNVLNNDKNVYNHQFTVDSDFIMKVTPFETSRDRCDLYRGEDYITYWRCKLDSSYIRVDKFFNDDFELEVFVL